MKKKNRDLLAVVAMFVLAGLSGWFTAFYLQSHSKHRQIQASLASTSALIPNDDSVEASARHYHYPLSFVASMKNNPDAGRLIFHEYCEACHGREPQVEVGAPKIGDVAVWSAFLKAGKKKMFDISANGLGAMPARGGCFECSDDQLQAAIDYILKNSQSAQSKL